MGVNLIMKARHRALFLLWKLVFIDVQTELIKFLRKNFKIVVRNGQNTILNMSDSDFKIVKTQRLSKIYKRRLGRKSSSHVKLYTSRRFSNETQSNLEMAC